MDRKIVKPAQEGGKIWNPDHNSFLPPGGAEVLMTPYWLALVQRQDIKAEDVPPAAAVTPPDPHLTPDTDQGAAPAA